MSQVIYAEDLPEIQSEYIEPYFQRFLMMKMESLCYGFETPDEVRKELKAINHFANSFCGIHARIAVSNEYDRFIRLDDKNMLDIARNVFKDM